VRDTLRLAKSIELLCATFDSIARDALVPADADGALGELDARRIVAARRMIDEQWREKLTLDTIARACGINRAKLTRGFRSMFDMTIADAIAERRLGGAGQMLRSTDLPVASIGYACGYLNNAAFTRAFSRRFGVAPTQYRAHRLAA
jgi:AraC family transcriptional regulator, transcriptional activator of the genes for pyochelin and ferripyochelin receptors